MSLPICSWDVCACCVSLSLQLLPRQVCVCWLHSMDMQPVRKMRLWIRFTADPAPCLIPVTTMNHVGHPGFSSLNHSLQHSPWCYTDCFEITSSLCALGLNFWPISIVDFMQIVKQVVSITFLFICLPKTCNIEILREESVLHCPTLLAWYYYLGELHLTQLNKGQA